jgi:hypothetical protein
VSLSELWGCFLFGNLEFLYPALFVRGSRASNNAVALGVHYSSLVWLLMDAQDRPYDQLWVDEFVAIYH